MSRATTRSRLAAAFEDQADADEARHDLEQLGPWDAVRIEVHHGGALEVDEAERRLGLRIEHSVLAGIPIGALVGIAVWAVVAPRAGGLSLAAILAMGALPGALFGVLFGGLVGIMLGQPALDRAQRDYLAAGMGSDEVLVVTLDHRRYRRWRGERSSNRRSGRSGTTDGRRRVLEGEVRSVLGRHHGHSVPLAP